jgi:hypothetical protein
MRGELIVVSLALFAAAGLCDIGGAVATLTPAASAQ